MVYVVYGPVECHEPNKPKEIKIIPWAVVGSEKVAMRMCNDDPDLTYEGLPFNTRAEPGHKDKV